METIKFIGLIFFTWLMVKGAAPVRFVKEFFGVSNDSTPKKLPAQLIQKFVNCSKCMGFWIGLIYYQDVLLACIVSLSAEAFERIVNKLSNYFTEI